MNNEFKLIKGQVRNRIFDHFDQIHYVQISNQVWDQIWGQISDQLYSKIWDQVRNQIYDQIHNQISDKK